MCDQHEMSTAVVSPQHSTLELAKHDNTAGAPERDHAGAAPEHRREQAALQVSTCACDNYTLVTGDIDFPAQRR